MSLSLNEIEATARKAARGAGYDWGLAEEAGTATRWLCHYGFAGCRALATVLQTADTVPIQHITPVAAGQIWQAPGAVACPVSCGTALSDRATQVSQSPFRFGTVLSPLLLLPFAHYVARQLDQPVAIGWTGFSATLHKHGVASEGSITDQTADVTVSACSREIQPHPLQTRADPDPTDWDCLLSFAARTYAPATEASRILGAGAGPSNAD